jgi:hypothetical protein
MQIGKPSKGGARKKKNYFYIGQGSSVFRILPPLGDLASQNVWSKYYVVHFGYENEEGYMRPFQSCEEKNRKTGMIEVDDPAIERIKKLNSQLEQVKERNKKSPSPMLEAKIEELEALVGFKGQYNVEKRHYVNALNDKGEIGLLGLKHKEKLAVDEARRLIESEDGVDPIDVNGAFLEFRKSGKALDTIVQVSGHMLTEKNESGKNVKTLNLHTLDQTVINRLEEEAFDLSSLYVTLTREEIETIVNASTESEAEGKAAVTAVFSKFQTNKQTASTKTQTVSPKVVKPTVVPDPDLSMEEETDETVETVALKKTETVSTKKTETVAAKKEEKVAVSKATSQPTSDDDFLASIGVSR